MDQLRQDHRHFRTLIDRIDGRVRDLEAGRTSDCQWLLDGIDLVRQQLDLLHGPVEALFEERLLQRSGRAHRLLEPLLHEDHRQFNEHCDRFADSLYGALNGRVVARDRSAGYGRAAIGHLYRQIAFEERAVFPYAGRLFTPDDWMALEEDARNRQDQPLVENGVRNDCRNLLWRLSSAEQ
jgi:hemerythrin-like domain-containing protein